MTQIALTETADAEDPQSDQARDDGMRQIASYVYAHALEHPYLNGTTSYPPADPSVGGGLVSLMSPMFPTSPVDVTSRLRELPGDGTFPGMPGWTWLHTPGQAPGHVSLWREADRMLIAGDAFITTKQESAYAAVTQAPELHGPPMYFTPDWIAAKQSVERLNLLAPDTIVTGHGRAMKSPAMLAALGELARRFDEALSRTMGVTCRNAR